MSESIEAGDDLAGKRAKFEAEKLTRRQALKRFGFRAAGAALAAFTVDDLARAVISRMEKEKMMRGMTDGIAKEFKNAGIAFAEPGASSFGCSSSQCNAACNNAYYACNSGCKTIACVRVLGVVVSPYLCQSCLINCFGAAALCATACLACQNP